MEYRLDASKEKISEVFGVDQQDIDRLTGIYETITQTHLTSFENFVPLQLVNDMLGNKEVQEIIDFDNPKDAFVFGCLAMHFAYSVGALVTALGDFNDAAPREMGGFKGITGEENNDYGNETG